MAPHLATRVQALQCAIVAGEFDGRSLDECLILELHRRVCADLIEASIAPFAFETRELALPGMDDTRS